MLKQMLKIIIPSISLLLMHKQLKTKWMIASISLMLLTFMCVPLLMYTPTPSLVFVNLHMFSDSLSAPLIMLTLWISAMMIIASQKIIMSNNSFNSFITFVLILNLTLILTFSTPNLILFYIMFELSLIPTLIIIMGWGYQPERLQAGIYLMMYTITASLPLLMSIMMIQSKTACSSMLFMPNDFLSMTMTKTWWLMSIMAFMVKMPMYLTHLWLPKAHVEAPVAGSMILAAVLLKLGSYGLIRMSTLFFWTNKLIAPMFISISLWGATMTSLICLRQTDTKSLIAYSSVGHMAILISGLMTNTLWGWMGVLAMMIAHGLVSSAMFSIANMTYETTHTRSMFLTKGLLNLIPSMSLMWFILTVMNMAGPPSINLMSEILLMSSILYTSTFTVIPVALTSFLATAYSLFLFTTTQHGQPPSSSNPSFYSSIRNMSIISLHSIPVIMLISSPQFITLWL
uniref:NADH-ubiquinone oxidoreductase chain 4 n=1 Tax=Glycera tridactyla TaxID=104710 RepID=A0A0S3CR33_GLYTI|nr:NADH dehydrogenase subunit 4 [Glycera tridactyla]